MRTLWQDIRYAIRILAKNSGFTAVVVLILAIAIGANTAIFSVVNAVMLRPLPYKDSQRLVTIQERRQWLLRSRPNFLFLRENNQLFESLAGFCGRRFYVSGIETPHETIGGEATSNLFTLLGVPPLLGRGFLPEDERPESPRVVVLSHAFWKEYLGGDPNAIGRDIVLTVGRPDQTLATILTRESYTIVGVTPPYFRFPSGRSVPLWRPILLTEGAVGPAPIPVRSLGRLKKGVTLERAEAELAVLAERLRRMDPEAAAERGSLSVERLLDRLVAGHWQLPLLLLGAAGFVLLIACSNVANLFLARATVRQREMAMRMALGASQGRIIRQMLTESLLVSLGAGVLGLILTFCTVRCLVRLCPADIPRLQETSVDLRVLGFTLGLSVLTGLLFGMMPAWRTSEIGVNAMLKEGTGRTTSGRGWRRFHDGLVVSQLGLSLVLLIGAALLIRSLMTLASLDLGFRPESVLAINIRLPEAKYPEHEQCEAFFQTLLERLRALPQVRSASLMVHAYDSTMVAWDDATFSIPGRTNPEDENYARVLSVSTGFFETMGIPLLRGRTFSEQDRDCIVIDETLASKYFSDIDPVGQILVRGGQSESTIIGVVRATRSFQTPDPPTGMIYAPGKAFMGFGVFFVRTAGGPMHLVPAVREQVAELEADRVIREVEPLEGVLSRMLAPRRFVIILLGLFAGIALALATIGIYGLLQYSTTRQTHDIGIRMALGARRVDVVRMVLGKGVRLTLIGVLTGIAGAVVLTRVLSSLLYDVTPTDPATLVLVTCVLVTIALLASYIPARRAARIDPMEALRHE